MTTYMPVDLHERIHDVIRKYLFNPPYKGMFGTADDLTEIVCKEIVAYWNETEEQEQ